MSNTLAADLPCDAWVALGAFLDAASLVAAGSSCRALQRCIMDNPGLWSRQLRHQYPAVAEALDASGRGPWHPPAAFKATSSAACQLLTTNEWSASTARPYPSNPPASALLRISRRDTRPGILAAALDQRLFFCFQGRHSDAAAGVVMSDAQHGHSAFVSALVEVPAGHLPGFATGSLDQTIKLWTPSKSSPVRTLRGHTGSVSALLCIPGSGSRGDSSSSAAAAAAAATLASASADKTVKIWSLSPLGGRGAGSCPANDATEQRDNTATTNSSSSSSRKARAHAASSGPLLATLRGHSDSVTDLLLPQAGAGSPGSLLSCGRDCRVKQWDLASAACVATWRLQGPCLRLVAGMHDLGAAVLPVLTAAGVVLHDTRQPGRPAAAGAGVLRLQGGRLPASGSLVCAAGHGCLVAAGGRRGVTVWDVRAPGSQQKGSSSGRPGCSGSSAPVLLSARMPRGEPVAALHLDRVKLVASTRRVTLHSGAGISVWSLPDGRRMQLSSTLTGGIDLQTARAAADAADGAAGIVSLEDAWDLLAGMTEEDMSQAINILHQQQQQPGQQQHAAAVPAPAVPADGAAAAGEEEEEEEEEQQDDGWQDEAASDSGDSVASSAGDSGEAGGGGRAGAWGRVEPGVIALAVDGPVIATVDTLGTVVMRDFTGGLPDLSWLQQQCRLPCSTADVEDGGPGEAVTGSAGAGPTDEARPSWQASKFWQQPRA